MNIDLNSSDVAPLSPFGVDSEDQIIDPEIQARHEYMNINPGQETVDTLIKPRPPPLPPLAIEAPEDGPRHCYANLEANEIESFRKRFSGVFVADNKTNLAPTTPPSNIIREVNYAVLDLDRKDDLLVNPESTAAPSPPDSPSRSVQKEYATIDFNKTVALSHSVNPKLVNDNEGSRKTRHNSTINDFSDAKNLTNE